MGTGSLVSEPRPGRRGSVRRFEPRLWSTDFNLATSGAIITRGRDGFDLFTTIRRNSDLGAAIWDCAFAWDHPWFRAEVDQDFTGVTVEFTLEVRGDGAPLAGLMGPSLAISTETQGEQYVRLWKYRLDPTDGDVWRNRFRIAYDETLLTGFNADGPPVAVDEITRIVIPAVPRDYQGGAVCTLQTEIVQGGTYPTVAVRIPGGRQPKPGDVLSIWPFTMATDDHTQLWINAAAPAGSGYPPDTFIITPAPAFEWPWANTIPVGASCQITSSASDEPLRDVNDVELRLRDLVVTGARASIVAEHRRVPRHSLGMTDGWDNAYPFSPELVVQRFRDLGYSKRYVMYVGMSHPQSFVWDAGLVRDGVTGGWVIDPDLPPVNTPTRRWFEDFAGRLAGLGIELWISVSFEILNSLCPPEWRQEDAAGSPALTGWDPPSSLVSPANLEGRAWLAALAIDFITICRRRGCRTAMQIGEPWWWVSAFEPGKPAILLPNPEDWVVFIYDPRVMAAWTAKTGLPVPTPRITAARASEEALAANQDYLAFCRSLLGETTNQMIEAIHAEHPGIDTAILIFTPQVLDARNNVPPLLNLPPVEQWGASRFTIVMIEDYDWAALGLVDLMGQTWKMAADLGYPLERTIYFGGFVLLAEDAAEQWPRIFNAINDAQRRGALQVMPWSREQVWRDGVVWTEPRALSGSGAASFDVDARKGWMGKAVEGLGTRVRPRIGKATRRVAIDAAGLSMRNAATGTITGTAEPRATIVVKLRDALVQTKATAAGTWSLPIAVTADDIGLTPIAAWQATDRGIHVPATGNLVVSVTALSFDRGSAFAVTGYLPLLEGSAAPGATVTVTVDGGPRVATANGSGRWSVSLEDVRSGGDHAIVATQETVLGALPAQTTATLTIAAYEAETWAILDEWTEIGTPATKARADGLDAILVKRLKTFGLWARLRCLYTPQHSVAATLVNLFDPTGPKLTPINSPSVIPDTSFGGDGVSSYFSTGINLLTNGGAFQQDSAFMFVWSLTDLSAATATDMGNSVNARVIGRNGATGTYNANAASRTFSNTGSNASYGWTRRNSTDQVAFRNGAVVDTHAQASSAVSSANLLIGQRGSSTFSARQFGCIAAGGALPTDDDIANFGYIVFDWLDFIGVF